MAPTSAAAASHHGVAAATPPASRESMPSRDWLATNPTKPVRPARRKTPPSHHWDDAAGSAAQPAVTVTANVARHTAACRHRPVSTRYGRKMSGTSLIPAASPIPAPCHQRRPGWHTSHTTRAMSSTSTWPQCRARCTGSDQNAIAVTAIAAPRRRRPAQPSAPKVSQTASPSASTPAAVITAPRTTQGTRPIAANSRAANGG